MTKFVCFSMGTLHALCLIFPLVSAPEKVQKRSGSRLQKFSNRLGRLLRFSFLSSFVGRGGRIRTSDLTLECPDFLLVFCRLTLSSFQLAESGEKA